MPWQLRNAKYSLQCYRKWVRSVINPPFLIARYPTHKIIHRAKMSLINKSIFFSIYLYFPLTEELVWTLQIATQYLTKTQAEESQRWITEGMPQENIKRLNKHTFLYWDWSFIYNSADMCADIGQTSCVYLSSITRFVRNVCWMKSHE